MGYVAPPVPPRDPPAGYRPKPEDTSWGTIDYGFHWPPWWHIVIITGCIFAVGTLVFGAFVAAGMH